MRFPCLLLLCATATLRAEPRVTPIPNDLRTEWKLAAFYKKVALVDGLPVLASDKVSDFAMKEAAYIVERMLDGRADVLKAIVKNKVRFAIMATTEFTLDVPEHSDLIPAAYWNKRARGLGATRHRPAVSCGEENLLGYRGDPYATESISVHEFAHVVHEMGLRTVDATFEKRLKFTFDEAKREGLWKNTYAMSNPSEYWAEGVQSWFHCNRTNDDQHNHINTRADLRKHDPRLAKLLEEAFPKNDWLYVKPALRRKKEHLEGYDPSKAPTFSWPDAMSKAYEEHQKTKGK
jgi:hypothetical protein